ncbi:MAG: FkbM family methyltransferase [Verrucomicrobia bacterium]|nr:FkbM family methyltransferase [Verrucomicrobiota bacterium]
MPHLKIRTGKMLIAFCDRFPRWKPSLQPWGLRTSKEWFGQRIVRAQMPGGDHLRLASVSQNYLSFELFWKGTGYYEPITTLVLQELIRPDDTFLDVGANVGFYSLVMSRTHPGLRVIAFEPNPRLFQLLSSNAAANQFSEMGCEPLALSDRNGTALLYLNQSDMSASLRDDFDTNLSDTIEVQTVTLDSFINQQRLRGRLVVKVDVEGNEEAFLEGARQTLAFRKPDLIMEVALNYGESTTALLKDNGYNFYQVTDRGLLESDTLTPVVREPFVFLNYLVSTKPKAEIDVLFGRIAARVRKIDLLQTSKHADFHALEQMKSRQQRPPAAMHTLPF